MIRMCGSYGVQYTPSSSPSALQKSSTSFLSMVGDALLAGDGFFPNPSFLRRSLPPPPPPSSSSPSSSPAKTSALDYAVVALIALGSFLMILGNLAVFLRRRFLPIKSKSVSITLLSSLGGLMFIFSTLVVNDHFPRSRRSAFGLCPLWTFWLDACFGFGLWLNCLTLHLIDLYTIFVCKKHVPKHGYARLLPLLLPAIGFSIAGTVKNEIRWSSNEGTDESTHLGHCKFKTGAVSEYGLISLLILYFLIPLGLAFRLRNAMPPEFAQYNEYRLIRRGGILLLFLLLLVLVTFQTGANLEPLGRCFLSAAVACTVFYYFWARNGVGIYHALMDPDEYTEKYLLALRQSRQHERENPVGTFRNMQTQLDEVNEKVSLYRHMVKQLEDEVKELEQEYHGMQQQICLLTTTSMRSAGSVSLNEQLQETGQIL